MCTYILRPLRATAKPSGHARDVTTYTHPGARDSPYYGAQKGADVHVAQEV